MSTRNSSQTVWLIVIVIGISMTAAMAFSSGTTLVPFVDAMPPRPTLPARADLAPPAPLQGASSAAPQAASSESRSAGAWIELRVPVEQPQAFWSVIQWEDHLGVRHDIEGWRGSFDQIENGIGKKVWWVDQAIFGARPFHWVVYDSRDGRVLGASQAFSLPVTARQTLVIEIPMQ